MVWWFRLPVYTSEINIYWRFIGTRLPAYTSEILIYWCSGGTKSKWRYAKYRRKPLIMSFRWYYTGCRHLLSSHIYSRTRMYRSFRWYSPACVYLWNPHILAFRRYRKQVEVGQIPPKNINHELWVVLYWLPPLAFLTSCLLLLYQVLLLQTLLPVLPAR